MNLVKKLIITTLSNIKEYTKRIQKWLQSIETKQIVHGAKHLCNL